MPEYTVTIEGKEYDVDAPNEGTAYRWAKITHGRAADAFKGRVAAQQEADRKLYDPTQGMSKTDKTLANIGAGMANLTQGGQQLLSKVGITKPVRDEEVREKRERDKALAKSTETGVGADWLPSAGSVLQFAGEVAPTLVIPAGALARGGQAVGMLPRALGAAAPIVDAALAGGLSGALRPTTQDESKLLNAGIGAAAGAVLPAAMAAARGVRASMTRAGGVARAPQMLRRALGEEAGNVAAAAERRIAERAGQSRAGRAIPESLAEATGSVRAGQIESKLGRDEATNEAWAAFKRAQNAARMEAIESATREAEQLAGRDAVRGAVTDPMRESALKVAGRDQWFHRPAVDAVERVMAGDSSANPAVRRVADFVRSSMDESAERAITPGRLYEVRKVLIDKLQGPSQIGDELSAAVKGADRETMALVRGIDEALNNASGGRWQRYLDTHTAASRPVDQARAAQELRNVFRVEGIPELGGAPEVTATRLSRALEASRGGSRDFPLELSPSARGGISEVQEGLTRANEVQKARKLAGTAGGGSQTSTDLALDSLASRIGGSQEKGIVSAIMHTFRRAADDAAKEELTRLLQDPRAAAAAIRAAQKSGRALSLAEEVAVQLLPRALGTAAGGAVAPEQAMSVAETARGAARVAALRQLGVEP